MVVAALVRRFLRFFGLGQLVLNRRPDVVQNFHRQAEPCDHPQLRLARFIEDQGRQAKTNLRPEYLNFGVNVRVDGQHIPVFDNGDILSAQLYSLGHIALPQRLTGLPIKL